MNLCLKNVRNGPKTDEESSSWKSFFFLEQLIGQPISSHHYMSILTSILILMFLPLFLFNHSIFNLIKSLLLSEYTNLRQSINRW